MPRTLTDLDQLKYRCVHLLLLHRCSPCRACFSDSLICFGYECDLRRRHIIRFLLRSIISLSLGVRDGRAKIRAHLQLVGRLVCLTDLGMVTVAPLILLSQVELLCLDIRHSVGVPVWCKHHSGNLFPIPFGLQSTEMAYLHCLSGCHMDCLHHCPPRPAHPTPDCKFVCRHLYRYLVCDRHGLRDHAVHDRERLCQQ